MIKILAVTPLYLPVMGGIEILVDGLAQTLRMHDIETVVATDAVGRLASTDVINGVPVHRFELAGAIKSGRPAAPLEVLRDMQAMVAAEQPDIVHLHSVTQASAFYIDRLMRKLPTRVPLVVTQHGVLEPVDQLGVTHSMLLQADVLTAVSGAVLTSALEFSGRDGASVVIGNGVAMEAMAAPVRMMPDRHELLCVGRLQREKGFDLAIRALAELRARGMDINLSLVGHGEDGEEFKTLAATLGVADHVHFRGVYDRAATHRAISECSALLVPSRTREGFSLVAAEAAMLGTPCIASDVGGLPETVEDGLTGIIVSSEDVSGLADAVVNLLDSESRWSDMSARAREQAIRRFSLDRCASAYADVYRNVLAGS